MKNKNIDNFAIDDDSWFIKAKWRRANRYWLRISQRLAVQILGFIRREGITKKEFACLCGFTEEKLDKMVKGQYDFKISEIKKLYDLTANTNWKDGKKACSTKIGF